MAAANLLHGATKQHHVVGGRKAVRRIERHLELARTKFAFEGANRKIQRAQLRCQQLNDWIELIDAQFGQIMIAIGQQAHRRRRRWLCGIFWTNRPCSSFIT